MTFITGIFEQPKGDLNPLGLKVPGEVQIHIRQTPGARYYRVFIGDSVEPLKVSGVALKHTDLTWLKSRIERLFELQIGQWREGTT